MIDKLHMPNANHDADALEIHKIVNTLKCLHYFFMGSNFKFDININININQWVQAR